jgi:hypothetical protein
LTNCICHNPFLGEAHQRRTIKEALDDAAASLQGRFVNDPMTEATTRLALGSIYIRIIESAEAETEVSRRICPAQSVSGGGDACASGSRCNEGAGGGR